MMKRYFCTLFDSGYLIKGVAMLQSLKNNCPGAHVFVLCMDTKTQSLLYKLELPFITCILLSDIEDEELLSVKKDRSVAEYCWTLSSWITWYVLQNNPTIDLITYLDADLFFYSPVEPIFDEIGKSSIAIIEHRFTPRLKDLKVNGIYCVEWVSFRRDKEGLACLSHWRAQCLEWCYYRSEEDRMGDQKYLDKWPKRYTSCHIIKHPGAGIAPWNYAQYKFEGVANGSITVEGEPLIFYHFHQFQLLMNGKFDRLSTFYTSECTEPKLIYEVYETTLVNVIENIRSIEAGFTCGFKKVSSLNLRRFVQRYSPTWFKNILRFFIRL